jgi:TatD DNase family protein
VRFEDLEQLAHHPKVVAIGETGLDYFRDQSEATKQKQVELFKKHIELAMRVNKPLMLHVRASKGTDDAYYDALEILGTSLVSGEGQGVRSANFHFFSGSKKCMQDIVAAGFTISVDGPITFSSDYDEMIKAVPFDKIMIETDAPFAAPAPYRGKTCEPWMVIEIAHKIAELKGLDLEVVRTQVLDNTVRFFNLDL